MYPNQEFNNSMNNEPSRKRKKWPIIILIILLIIIGIFIYLNFFTDTFDFIKPNEDYEEFDPNAGNNEKSNSNSQSNSNSNSNSNKNIAVKSVSISPDTLTTYVGGSTAAIAVITPSNATNQNVTWTSSDESVATIDSKGVITGKKVGTATITVTTQDGNYKASKKVTVVSKAVSVTSIKLNKSSITMNYNESTNLIPTIYPNTATNQTIIWSSSNPSIVTVEQNGTIKAISKNGGTVTITATTLDGNYKATCKVTAKPYELNQIRMNILKTTIYIGESYSPEIKYYPNDAINKTLTWTSSDTSIATVSSSGKITAISEGNVSISATTSNELSVYNIFYIRENPANWEINITKNRELGDGRIIGKAVVYKNGQPIVKYKNFYYNGSYYNNESGTIIIGADTSIKTTTLYTEKGYALNNVKVTYDLFD